VWRGRERRRSEGGREGGSCESGVVEEECEQTVRFGLIWEEEEE
jgi:hypothetical protein